MKRCICIQFCLTRSYKYHGICGDEMIGFRHKPVVCFCGFDRAVRCPFTGPSWKGFISNPHGILWGIPYSSCRVGIIGLGGCGFFFEIGKSRCRLKISERTQFDSFLPSLQHRIRRYLFYCFMVRRNHCHKIAIGFLRVFCKSDIVNTMKFFPRNSALCKRYRIGSLSLSVRVFFDLHSPNTRNIRTSVRRYFYWRSSSCRSTSNGQYGQCNDWQRSNQQLNSFHTLGHNCRLVRALNC